VFFLIRSLSFTLRQEKETQLPLTRADECVNVDDVLDLSESPEMLILNATVIKYPNIMIKYKYLCLMVYSVDIVYYIFMYRI